jgi:dethiobiotin synthetase
MSTLARELGMPVIIVARAGLGTINHALLSLEAVQRDAIAIAAVVLSERPEDEPSFTQSNRTEILRRWSGSAWFLRTIHPRLTISCLRGSLKGST